jgi:hypothetical protein
MGRATATPTATGATGTTAASRPWASSPTARAASAISSTAPGIRLPGTRGEVMETSPLTLVSIVRKREDGTYGTLDPVEVERLSEDLRVRCLEAIERYRAEHGTAPNALTIETTGNILASYQTG